VGVKPCTTTRAYHENGLSNRGVGEMSGYGSRHSAGTQQLRRFRSEADMNRIYEYAPFCNGPGEVKSPELSSRRRAHASVRGQR
jgi:hypothetical protein